MDRMASSLDKPAGATASAPTASEGAVAQGTDSAPPGRPAEAAPLQAPAAPDPSLAKRRGYAIKDWSNEVTYILIKMDADKAAELLAKQINGKVTKNVLGKPVDDEAGAIVFQLAGHPWSIFAMGGGPLETLVPALSREADVIMCWNSDFNGWSGVDLYRGGEEAEAVHWGFAGDAFGKDDTDASRWQSRENVGEDLYQFRSKLRKVPPTEVQKGAAFVDSVLRGYDAYLPDLNDMPWLAESGVSSPLGAAAFKGVHSVDVPETR
jgi:hypothetical protein